MFLFSELHETSGSQIKYSPVVTVELQLSLSTESFDVLDARNPVLLPTQESLNNFLHFAVRGTDIKVPIFKGY